MLAIPDTSWDFGSFVLYEPVTVLTDLVVTAVCWHAFFQLKNTPAGQLRWLFRAYFLTMGLATAYGGIIGHGFIVQLGFVWKMPGWFISMFSVALLERAAIFHAQPLLSKKTGRWFARMNLVELFSLCAIVAHTQNFFFVEAHAAYGMLVVVLSLELYIYRKTTTPGSQQFLIAIGIATAAAGVHLFELDLHRWFNHLDISHTLMALAAWYFYKGAAMVLQEDRPLHH
jgi:hypothetical protein